MPAKSRPYSLPHVYKKLNKQWFNNNLPADTMVVWAPMRDMGATVESSGGQLTVAIHKCLKKWPLAAEATLLHEMAHVATWDEAAMHGPKWQKVMRRLVSKHAFTKYL